MSWVQIPPSDGGGTDTGITELTGEVTAGPGPGSVAATVSSGLSALKISTGIVNNTEYNYLDGVTSNIQVQLDAKATSALANAKIFIGSAGNLAVAQTVSGVIALTNAGVTSFVAGSIVNADINASAAVALTKLAATTVSRALVSDGSGFITPATTTATEIGYVNGVTSSIQTQLNAKASTTLTSAHILVGNVSNVATDVAVTGDIGIDNTGLTSISSGVIVNADVNASAAIAYSKLNLSASIVNADVAAAAAIAVNKLAALTASRAVVSDGSGFLSPATTTSTEIGYVNGVTSAIQTQLNAKASTTLTSAHILVGNVSNVATDVAMSGDITIDNAGVTNISSGVIVNADVNASAAIAYSKLSLSNSILNADIAAGAAIAYSKLALSNSIVNADVNTSAAIAYSKLALSNSIVNADIGSSAAIAFSKLASLATGHIIAGNGGTATDVTVSGDITIGSSGVTAIGTNKVTNSMFRQSSGLSVVGNFSNVTSNVADILTVSDGDVLRRSGTTLGFGTIANTSIAALAAISLNKMAAVTASRALVSDGSGFVSAATTTSTEIGYVNGVTSALQTQLNSKPTGRTDGSFAPPTIADGSAVNNSVYFSSTSSKLVYKDSGGSVNALY